MTTAAGRAGLVTVLRCLLAAMLGAAALGVPATRAVAATGGTAPAPRGVLLVLVPDLRWHDLAAMPALSRFAAASAEGVLSVRSEGQQTRCGDGLLELSAGTRVPSGVARCDLDAAAVDALRARYRQGRFGAELGVLGRGTAGHATAVGPAAAVALAPARTAGSVAAAFAADPQAVVGVVDDGLYAQPGRRAAAMAVDTAVAAQLAQAPASATVMVVGCSDGPTGGPHLHPLLVSGPGWTHRALVSSSTRHPPYVQLFDVTATVLALEGAPVPDSVSGHPVRVSAQRTRSAAAYDDLDRHARRALAAGHPTFTVLCVVLLLALLLAAVRRPGARLLAALLVVTPLATWLIQLLPWWRWPPAAYVGILAAACAAGALVATVATARAPAAAVVVGPVLTAAVLVADQLAGAPLQVSAPFGDNPLIAGRFHGMGNIDFGVTAAALLLCAALAGTALAARRRAVVAATALCLLAVVVDGAPPLGDDVGGVLALVPAAALLVARVARLRVTWRRAVVTVVGAVAVATVVSVGDYLRPAASRTHAGRFVGQVLHGGAWRVVHRKLHAVLTSFGNPLVTLTLVVGVALLVWIARRTTAPLAAAGDGAGQAVILAAPAVAVLAVLGTLLNDSGAFVGAAVLLGFAPAALVSRLGDNRRS